MATTVRFNHHNAQRTTQVIKTIGGIDYIHFQFAKFKHDVSIKINGTTYYKLKD